MQIKKLLILLLAVLLLLFIYSTSFSITAFPGAEGFGAQTTGGRGGKIVKVTNLLDYNSDPKVDETPIPGSFRYAVEGDLPWPEIDEEPKTVVFEVSGIIRVKSQLTIGRNTTVAGQTSPAGITFYNWPRHQYPSRDGENGGISIRSNVIIRHIRVRGAKWKGIPIGGSGYGEPLRNVILDHVSVSWAGDETITFWQDCQDITIQWCTVEESVSFWHGEGVHNCGCLIGFDPGGGKPSGNYNVHHTLFAHHHTRCPKMDLGGRELMGDCRNCVMYDAGRVETLCSDLRPSSGKFNIISNYRKSGISSKSTDIFGLNSPRKDSADWLPLVYMEGNFVQGKQGASQDDLVTCWNSDDGFDGPRPLYQADEIDCPFINTHSAQEAYDLVLAQAGAWPRDSTTRRTIKEVKDGTGSWVMMDSNTVKANGQWEGWGDKQYNAYNYRFFKDDPNDWPDLPVPTDSDNDGMPDAWEDSAGLDKNTADHNGMDLSKEGYTNIEVYINQVADNLAAGQITKIKLGRDAGQLAGLKSFCCPNPFSSRVHIIINSNRQVEGENMTLNICDINGKLVKRLTTHSSQLVHGAVWDGLDNNGNKAGPGNYFCYFLINKKPVKMKKLMLIN
ncbi:MAG: FlgD immunoglobulin-like domain containing protein [bacterium]